MKKERSLAGNATAPARAFLFQIGDKGEEIDCPLVHECFILQPSPAFLFPTYILPSPNCVEDV